MVFFTTIMTAMMWVGALDYCLTYTAPSIPRWVAAWCVALLLCVARWVLLWHVGPSSCKFVSAMQSYPSTPDLALSVGLVGGSREQARLSPLPSLHEVHTASVGLGALVFAWGASVALQAAATAPTRSR